MTERVSGNVEHLSSTKSTHSQRYPHLKCYNEGYSTSKCREQLLNLDSIGLPIYSITPDKSIQSIMSLPRSCQELDNWNITISVNSDVTNLGNAP